MKKFILLILFMSSLLAGCAVQQQSLGFGVIQNSVDPITATAEADVPKMGKACGYNIFGLYAGGDMSIELAKNKGSITKVSSVNNSVFSFLGLVARKCTIVTGS